MKALLPVMLGVLWLATGTLGADEFLPVLKANGTVYSNVTVTTITATDIFFSYTNGMSNAKLKNLSPELQKHFNYDAVKGAQAEKKLADNKIQYRQYVLNAQAAPATKEQAAAAPADDGDFVAPKLYARSVRGQAAPPFVAQQWITPPPEINGRFTLIDFWATWCGPCRRSIPELNAFSAKYHDRLVVIGISDETEAAVRQMKEPHIDYTVAIDPQARMMRTLAVTGIPHCILVDPHGIVRYEGMPTYLNDARLQHFLDKYK